MPGYPVRVWDTSLPDDPTASEPRQANRIMSTPSLGDLDGDKVPDIVVGTNENYSSSGRVYAISGKTGQFLPGFPIAVVSTYILPVVGSGIPNAAALADLDGDKIPEIAVSGIGGAVKVYDHTGKVFRAYPNDPAKYGPKANFTDTNPITIISNPAFGDLDDDGTVDIAYGVGGLNALLAMATGGQRKDYEMGLGVWDTKSGALKPGFPSVMEDYQFFMNPIFADVDGDGHTEVLNASAGYFLHAQRADGSEPDGWPKFTGGWIAASPAVGDLDGDGKLEVAIDTRDGWLYAWHTTGSSTGRIDWDSFHHDARNTGNFDEPLDQGVRAGQTSSSGCSCAMGDRRAESPLLFGGFALALVWIVRRATRRSTK